MKTNIEKCTKKMDSFDWGTLDILEEYLYNDWLLECYDKGPFYSILNTYKKSNHETQEALKHYALFRKRKIQAEEW
ncbi:MULTISPECIES: hypothetical protein [Enterobacterales]|uniref:hypothetical protein n=1 Tax=Xenorhabdus bovienii TaxID=40576 RepID=UPI0023B32327|nr:MULTISPECIES: hypothetical protein [Enterobacterales]MDE9545124.1 hypothetical protein [Xenorhabdus bovienii]